MDSSKQASDRDSRAARRTIRKLPSIPSDDSSEEYNDCETSGLFGLDGADDRASLDGDMVDAAAAAAAELTRQRGLPVEDADFENDAEAWKKELKVKFDPHDVEYWFNTTEAAMVTNGINRQWDKKNAIVPLLPEQVVEECKPLLRLSRNDAGGHIYKELKSEILQLYGSKDEDVFKKAMALRLTGRPSALGKKLVHIICPGIKPMEGCHCSRMIYGFWEAQLSAPIKIKIAGKKFNHATYKDLFKEADEAWLANGGAVSPAVVAAVTESPSNPPTTDPQVAAIAQRGGRGRGRGNRGGRGRGGGGRGQNSNSNNSSSYNQNNNSRQDTSNNTSSNSNTSAKPHQKGQKHSDLPSSAPWACAQHWRKGRGAPYCSDPLVCQWKDIVAPRGN